MEKGVYLPSTNIDSTLLVECLKVMLEMYPSIKFTSIEFDKNLCGYKIHFSEPDDAVVLEKHYLAVGNRHVWIYPLQTFLTTDLKSSNASLKDLLAMAISKKFESRPEIISDDENYRIQISIPEFKGLPIFYQVGYPDMTINVPNYKDKVKLEFFCRHCKKSGHVQHECVLKYLPEMSTGNRMGTNSSDKIEAKSTKARPKSTSRSPLKDPIARTQEFSKFRQKTIHESINSMAEKIGRETVLSSGIISEENLNLGKTQRNDLPSSSAGTLNPNDREIKKENDDNDNTQENGIENNKNDNSVNNEDHGRNREPKEEPHTNEDSLHSFGGTVSNDDEIQIIDYPNNSSPNISRDSHTTGKDGAYNSEDASRSPPAARSNYSFPSFSGNGPFTPSTPGTTNSTSKPISRVEVTSVLSDRLQECINDACNTCKILDRKTLDAFLIHVKKKSNPVRVALNFTKNTNGLKGQLERILHLYYNTPQTGTKEDMQFIKWLNGLVGRFDGTIPRKRKRNEQSFDEPPNKI